LTGPAPARSESMKPADKGCPHARQKSLNRFGASAV
jgi:hypothetical protein